MNRTRRLMAILLSIMVFLSSMPFGVLAETLMEEEHVHAEPDAEALSSTESSACEHANVEWSDTASILLENLKDPAFNEPYSESKHLYTGPVTRSGFCPDCEITLTREEESAEPYYESHSFGLDGLCSVCGLEPVCDHAGAN